MSLTIKCGWIFLVLIYFFGTTNGGQGEGSVLHFEKPFVTQSSFPVSGNHTTTNSTPSNNKTSGWPGYVGSVIAVLFFGSNFVPIKKFETGDGMFFQWVLCVAIWISGLVTNCIQGFPTFYPLAMLGGVLWATGNICVVPVVKTIGLGLGLLIWGSFNLLSGWASGRFGWFGLKPEAPPRPTLNYIAVALAMTSSIFWVMVKSDVGGQIETSDVGDEDDDQELLSDDIAGEDKRDRNLPWEERLSPTLRRVVGILLSIFSGTLYGLSFTPVIYIKENYHGASKTDIDYVFAHFCGIFLTSTIYFVIYCIIMKNKPKIYPAVILPAIVSGAMWGIADIGWFIANNYLSEAVSFPIITTGPGVIASLWSVFVFKEIRGCRNFVIMGVAYTFTITGAVLAGLSKA
ncbi:transmembrane protein 144-like [Clavelina lepadiformis]|uniref:Transmembrane protein 144 n=1 Tax=Clavelina lepadiformis TaxID=159417 RepID=A0ABP0G2I4_CLALP